MFPDSFNLLKICPEQQSFQVFEFCFFHATDTRFFILTENPHMAHYHFNLLIELNQMYGEKVGVFDMKIVKKAEIEYDIMKTGNCLKYMKEMELSKNQ